MSFQLIFWKIQLEQATRATFGYLFVATYPRRFKTIQGGSFTESSFYTPQISMKCSDNQPITRYVGLDVHLEQKIFRLITVFVFEQCFSQVRLRSYKQ